MGQNPESGNKFNVFGSTTLGSEENLNLTQFPQNLVRQLGLLLPWPAGRGVQQIFPGIARRQLSILRTAAHTAGLTASGRETNCLRVAARRTRDGEIPAVVHAVLVDLEGLLVRELCAEGAHVGVDVAAVEAALSRRGPLLCGKLHHGQQGDATKDDHTEHLGANKIINDNIISMSKNQKQKDVLLQCIDTIICYKIS